MGSKKPTPEAAPAPAAPAHPLHGGVYERAPDGALALVHGVDDHPARTGAAPAPAADRPGDAAGDINAGL